MTEPVSHNGGLQEGQHVDHYRVHKRIGRGGMGEVYLARDERLGRKVALKVISALRQDARSVRGFLEEARVTAQFSHPHIVTIYGVGEVDGRPYLALEYLEGQSLRERLLEQRLPVGQALRLASAVAQALAEAHGASVLHRDLKPENIVLARDGRPRVVDFGLARMAIGAVSASTGSLETQLAGTPLYMAPEIWNQGRATGAADVWAFGLVLFEMLAGVHPFADDSHDSLGRLRVKMNALNLEVPELPTSVPVPDGLQALLARCLDIEPERRPSASELVRELERIVRGKSAAVAEAEESPFRGLLAFQEAHAAEFYGREAELAQFLERLEREPVLPLVGPSGAGKSSFVQAGVIPRLREQDFWLVVQLRPGRSPFEALASRLGALERLSTTPLRAAETLGFDWETEEAPAAPQAATDPGTSPAALAARLAEAPGALHLVLRDLAEAHRCRVLLVVDQLEELFTLVEDDQERHCFMRAVALAADDADDPLRVIFTVRDDFLGRVAETAEAAEALGQVVLIRPMAPDALAQTLERPLLARGYRFDDPTLVSDMVREVAGSSASLPLLQFAARMLWERRDVHQRVLRRRDYEEIGGVAGALARHADEVILGLADGRELARQMLLRLVTADGTKRSVPWSEALDGLDAAAEDVLQRLVQARLVVVHEGLVASERLVELAHESLIVRWARLRRWHLEAREEVRALGELEEAARLWDRRGRRSSELWSGETLMDADRAIRGTELPLSSMAKGFLDAARQEQQRVARTQRTLRLGALMGALAVTVGSLLAAYAYSGQRTEALAQAAQAEAARAEALASGAAASLSLGEPLAAQAKLRSSLQVRDSAAARALWWSLQHRPEQWRLDTPYWPHGHAMGAGAEHVVVAGSDGILRRFDLRTGDAEAFRGGDGSLAAAATLPDGSAVAAVSFEGEVRVWRGDDVQVLGGVPSDVYPYRLDFLDDSTLQLYLYWPAGFETAMVRWDLRQPSPSPVLVHGTQGHGRAVVSGDGRRLVSGNPRGGPVSAFDLTGQGAAQTIGELERADRMGQFALHPSGDVVAVGRKVVAFAGDGSIRRFAGMDHSVRAAGFIDAGKTLVGLDAQGVIRLWDFASGRLERELRVRIEGDPKIIGGSISDEGQLFVRREGGLLLLDLHRAEVIGGRARGFVEALDVHPGGEIVASGGQNGRVLLHAADGVLLATLEGAQGAVSDVRFDRTGELLLASASSGRVVLWRVEDRRQLLVLPHGEDVKGAVFTDTGVLVGTYSGWLRHYDLTGLREGSSAMEAPLDWSLRLPTNVFDLDVLGDRGFVVSDFYGALHLGRVGTSDLRRIDAHKTQIHTVKAFGADRVVSIGFDGFARLWEVSSGKALSTFTVTGAAGMAVSGDGAFLLAGDEGRSVLIRVSDGYRLPIVRPGHVPSGGAFGPDGTTVYIGDYTGAVHATEVRTGLPVWTTIAAGELWLQSHRDEGRGTTPMLPEQAWAADSAFGHDCVLTRDGGLIHGDASGSAGHATAVAAGPSGCWVLQGAQARVHQGGAWRDLPGTWTALRVGPALVGATQVAFPGTSGLEVLDVGPGVTTAARWLGQRWVGWADGGVSRVGEDASLEAIGLQGPPASAVVLLGKGPAGSLFTGHQDGQLVLWDVESGAALLRRRLHGAPTHLVGGQGRYLVGTDTGDRMELDLSVFEAADCALLAQVEAQVPTVWRGDRAVVDSRAGGRCTPER